MVVSVQCMYALNNPVFLLYVSFNGDNSEEYKGPARVTNMPTIETRLAVSFSQKPVKRLQLETSAFHTRVKLEAQ